MPGGRQLDTPAAAGTESGSAISLGRRTRSMRAMIFEGNWILTWLEIWTPTLRCRRIIMSFSPTSSMRVPDLGVAGTPICGRYRAIQGLNSYGHAFANLDHVSGACQLFRRRCFEEIGGYTPIKGGGIDWVAVTTARMRGWTTRTFLKRTCAHHRAMGTAVAIASRRGFVMGRKIIALGTTPSGRSREACFK